MAISTAVFLVLGPRLYSPLCGDWTSRTFAFLLAGDEARGHLQNFVHENQSDVVQLFAEEDYRRF